MKYEEEAVLEASADYIKTKNTVYLIGDSSTMGYRENVKKFLSGVSNVVYPEENGRSSQYVITMLRTWSGLCDAESVKVVQFNTGHWDIAHWNDEDISLTSVDEYCKNILRISESLKKMYKNAVIVFATTMPMNPNGENSVNYRYTREIKEYNEAAKRILKGKDVIINDLFGIAEHFTPLDYADYCHLTEKANERIGLHCASLYGSLLK